MEKNLTVKKAIEEITYFSEIFPEEQFKVLSENQEEAIPYLMEGLKKAIREMEQLDNEYELHLYALYLLAQFGYKEAFPTVLELISVKDDTLDSMLGDLITSGLNDILYCLYDGNFNSIQSYIINTESNNFAKSAALNLCVQLLYDGAIDKQTLIDMFKKLIYEPVIDDYVVDTSVVGAICDCHLISMLPDVKYLFREDRVDEYVHGEYDSCVDLIFDYGVHIQRGCRKIENAADELRNWSMFKQPESEKVNYKRLEKANYKRLEKALHEAQRGMNKTEKKAKTYPNDPCPCGSGKKYKKCCMNKPKESSEDERMMTDRTKWLNDYPADANPRIDGRVYLEDYYDAESIETDKLIYLGMQHRPGFMSERETNEEKSARQLYYLRRAFSRYSKRCNAEGITSFGEYDEKYGIHYDSFQWLNLLIQLLSGVGATDELKEVRDFCKSRTDKVSS